jgi:hypothetical protein
VEKARIRAIAYLLADRRRAIITPVTTAAKNRHWVSFATPIVQIRQEWR